MSAAATGRLVMLSGPSCVGKSPLKRALARFHPQVWSRLTKLVLYNSRAPRPGEVDGADYDFRTQNQVEALRPDPAYAVLDIGELVTYLNDLVLLAPSMLLVPAVTWTAVDARSFDLSLTDHGHTVKARVFIDDRGAPVNCETTDRFYKDPSDPKRLMRARWSTPMEGFHEVDGRQVPTRGLAVWRLAQGDFPYADFELVSEGLDYNVQPGA